MKKQTTQMKLLKEYVFIVIGSILVGLSYNIFLLPARLAAGGVSGISTILFELYQFNPAFVQWLINIPLFFAGLILLGKEMRCFCCR